ncbi:MAG: HAD-IA family hydrolase [Nocardioides sp.]
MTPYTACLVDVYETALSVDLPQWGALLAATAGVEPRAFAAAVSQRADPVADGRLTVRLAIEETLTDLGVPTDDGVVDRVLAADQKYVREQAVLHEDTVPFLESLRAKGVRTAFVSNCADNTRPLLGWLGLDSLVDELVLSCEVRAAKPDPRIFEVALARLGVAAESAVFVDDQPAFCDAATALGIRAVLIDRVGGAGEVSTLADLADYF